MKNKTPSKPILVIHGPNMNLISHRSIAVKKRLTLDKINKRLRKEAKTAGYDLRVIQTNSEAQAATSIHRLRNKISGIIIFPGPWQNTGHIIKDALGILQTPFVTISTGEKAKLLKGISNIQNTDLLTGCQIAVERLIKSGKL